MIAAPASALARAPWRVASPRTEAAAMFYVGADGRLRFRAHAGQQAALDSTARFVLVLAGLQSGKTSAGPWWMMREMALCGPGDYLGAGPTFPLMEMKMLPEYEALFVTRMGWGRLYRGYPPVLELNERGRAALFGSADADETRIIFGAGSKSESLESATVKAAHLDEPGQRQFRRGSHEAVLGRLSIHRGRVLYTTTPYGLGWLKAEVYDRAVADRALPPSERTYELVQFRSTMNPAFPRAEFDEMRAKLPGWKFGMRYEGRFERPAGLIYDVFDRAVHVTPAFAVPAHWPRYDGLDFGAVNTAAVVVRQEPGTLRYVATRAYHAGSRTAAEHAAALCPPGTPKPVRAWGGAPSEDNWRREFGAAGLPIARPPVVDVEVGIDRGYALLKNHPARVRDFTSEDESPYDPSRPYVEFMDGAPGVADLADDFEGYSRVLDENDEPTERIEDKETWHLMDAFRYLSAGLVAPAALDWSGTAPPSAPRFGR